MWLTCAVLQIQDRSPESRPVASRNQSQTQLTRPVATGLGMQRAPNQELTYHSVARYCVHYCKSDTSSQWERAIFGPQGLRNDSTNEDEILHN